MKKKIILHIGFPKTGTTTIQNFLHERRTILLREKKILYPSLDFEPYRCIMYNVSERIPEPLSQIE